MRHPTNEPRKVMNALLPVCLMAAAWAWEGTAQDKAPPPAAPGVSAPAIQAEEDLLNVPFLYGVVIITNRSDLKPTGVPRERPLKVPAGDPLLNSEEFQDLVLPFCQRRMTTALMEKLQTDIILFYRRHDRPLVDVLFEEQVSTNGVLQVTVLEGRLGQIKMQTVDGRPYNRTNGWSNPDLLRKAIRLQAGSVITEKQLSSDVVWLNRNPFRKVTPYFTPGGDFAQSDLLLRVEEQKIPFAARIGYENIGSQVTGEDWLFAGLTWGKAFGLQDHVFDYQLYASTDWGALLGNVASYTAPLPWRHTARVFGYYVNVDGEVDGNTLEGPSYQTSLRYDIPLPVLGRLQHEFSAGLDFKSFENNLIFGVGSEVNTPYQVFQTVFGYTAYLGDRFGSTRLGGQFFYSPGDVTSKNTDEFYDDAHMFAEANYVYGRLTAERETRLFWERSAWTRARIGQEPTNCVRWILRGAVQVAGGNLVPSEQLGLGGYATVRGYAEREANGDQGWWVSNELRSPPINLTRLLGLSRLKVRDALEFLAFWDYGVTRNKILITTPGSAEPERVTLSGVGPGLRYTVGRNFSLRFDYGFPLKQTDLDPKQDDDPRAHIGVMLSY